jgi:hypothetical protein
VGLAFSPQQLDLSPGQAVDLLVTVRNAGEAVDQYSMEVDGLPPSWYALDAQSLTLFPGDSVELRARVNVPQESGAISGAYPFAIAARSRTNPAWVGAQNGLMRLTVDSSRKTAAVGAKKGFPWGWLALLGVLLLAIGGGLVAWNQGWLSFGSAAVADPTPTPTVIALTEPTFTSGPVAVATSTTPPSTATPTVVAVTVCNNWSVEHRGSRDTRIPPGGVPELGPYTINGVQYTHRADFTSWVYVDATGIISDIRVADLDLFKGEHNQPQAITGALISPDNVRVNLFTWACDPGSLVSMHVTLDDAAAESIPYSCSQNFNGIFKPDGGELSTFKGQQAQGNWILEVTIYTQEPFHTSYFNRWGLDLCVR